MLLWKGGLYLLWSWLVFKVPVARQQWFNDREERGLMGRGRARRSSCPSAEGGWMAALNFRHCKDEASPSSKGTCQAPLMRHGTAWPWGSPRTHGATARTTAWDSVPGQKLPASAHPGLMAVSSCTQCLRSYWRDWPVSSERVLHRWGSPSEQGSGFFFVCRMWNKSHTSKKSIRNNEAQGLF